MGLVGYWRRVGDIAFDTLVRAPRRRRAHDGQHEDYTIRTQDGLSFGIVPGQWVDTQIAIYGIAERRFLEAVGDLLPDAAMMIDVGANIGNHAIFLSRRCSAIHCFEPNPTAWQRLERNIAANQLTNVHVHRVGLGEHDEVAAFHENVAGNLGNSGFANAGAVQGSAGYRIVELPLRNADREIAALRLDRIDFIKIDVEGLEEQVVAALAGTIARHRPMVSFEHHGHQAPPGQFVRMAVHLPGYQLFEVVESPDGARPWQRLSWLLRHAARPRWRQVVDAEPRTYDNLLAVPEGSAAAFKLAGSNA